MILYNLDNFWTYTKIYSWLILSLVEETYLDIYIYATEIKDLSQL